MIDSEALKQDKSFYPDYDAKTGQHGVFGNVTSHMYSLHHTHKEAKRVAEEMNRLHPATTMQEMLNRVDQSVRWPKVKNVRLLWYITFTLLFAIGAVGYYFIASCTDIVGCK